MSLYKIRESTMTVGGSFTPDSGKTFFTWLSTSPAVNNWRLLCGKGLSISIILKTKFFRFSLFYAVSNNPTICNSLVAWPASSFWPLKSLLFWLKYWDTSFLLQRRCIFWGFKEAKRISSFSLTECLLCSPCWRLANTNRQVYPFIPSSYPMWLLGLSPNEALCKTSKDKKEGEWTHLHRAYEGFNIWLIVFLCLRHIF